MKKKSQDKMPLPSNSGPAGVFDSIYVTAKDMKSAMTKAWKEAGKLNYFMASRVGLHEKKETWRFDYSGN